MAKKNLSEEQLQAIVDQIREEKKLLQEKKKTLKSDSDKHKVNLELQELYKKELQTRRELSKFDDETIDKLEDQKSLLDEIKSLAHESGKQWKGYIDDVGLSLSVKIQTKNIQAMHLATATEKNLREDINSVANTLLENQKELLNANFDAISYEEQILELKKIRSKVEAKIGFRNQNLTQELLDQIDIQKQALKIQKASADIARAQDKIISTGVEEMQSKVDNVVGALKSVPGGNLLSASFGLDSFQEDFSDNMKRSLQEGEGLTGGLSKGFKNLGGSIKSGLSSPLTKTFLSIGLISAAVFALWKMFTTISQETRHISDNLGISTDTAKDMALHARDWNAEIAGGLATLEDIHAAEEAAVKTFGKLHDASKEVVDTIVVMNKLFGTSLEDASEFSKLTQEMGVPKKQLKTFSILTANLATAADVPIGDVMADVAANAEMAHTFFKGSPKALAKTAVELKRIGLSLSDASSIMDGILDIESSLANEMEAQVMLGAEINFDKARVLALQGDIEGAVKDMANQMGSIDAFNEKDLFQKEAMAKAMGLSVSQLGEMLTKQDTISHMSDHARKNYEKAVKDFADMNVLTGDKLQKDAEAAVIQEKMRASWDNIKTQLGTAIIPLTEALIPILSSLANFMTRLAGGGKDVSHGMDKTKEAVHETKKELSTLAKILKTAFFVFVGTKVLKGIFAMIRAVRLLNAEHLKTKLLTAIGSKGSGTVGIASKAPDTSGGLTKSLSKMPSPKSMLAGGAAMLMIAGAIWILSKAMQQFSDGVSWKGVLMGITSLAALTIAAIAIGTASPMVLLGAVAMGVLSGAMWILSKAMQGFAKSATIAVPFFKTVFTGISQIISAVAGGFVSIMDSLFTGLTNLGKVGSGLLTAAAGITAVSAALLLFAGGSAISGVVTGLTKLFNVDPASQFAKIAETADGLHLVAQSLLEINKQLFLMSDADINIKPTVKSVEEVSKLPVVEEVSKLSKNIISSKIPLNKKSQSINTSSSDQNSKIIELLEKILGSTNQPIYVKLGDKFVNAVTAKQTLKSNMVVNLDDSYGRTF